MPGRQIFFLFPTALRLERCALGKSTRTRNDNCTVSMIGSWYYKKCGVKTLMIMIILLGGAMHIKNARPRKQKQKKSSCLLLGTHQDTGIGVSQKMKKGIQKHCRHKYGLFCI